MITVKSGNVTRAAKEIRGLLQKEAVRMVEVMEPVVLCTVAGLRHWVIHRKSPLPLDNSGVLGH